MEVKDREGTVRELLEERYGKPFDFDEKQYVGWRDHIGRARVSVVEGNETRELEHHVRHSPDGFNWGYLGSGCAELARCILADAIGLARADRLYQDFKHDYIAPINSAHWKMRVSFVVKWCEKQERVRGLVA